MACYSPLRGYPGAQKNSATGKYPVVFAGQKARREGALLTVPCGVCIGCRIDRAEAWAIRATHRPIWPSMSGRASLGRAS